MRNEQRAESKEKRAKSNEQVAGTIKSLQNIAGNTTLPGIPITTLMVKFSGAGA